MITVENAVEASSDVTERLPPAFGRLGERVRQTIAFLPLLAIGFATLAAISALGWVLTRSERLFNRIAPNAFIAETLRRVVRFVFVFAGIVVALDLIGATALLGTLLGAAGIIGLEVGFGVRDTIENFVASVTALETRPSPPPPPPPPRRKAPLRRCAAAPKDDTIERKVEADRRAAPATDLLDPDALTGD